MSNLKEVVKSDPALRNVSPEILSDLDMTITRAIIKLQRRGTLPPRTWEFTSLTERQEKRTSDDEFQYSYYYLPDDFRELDEFYIYNTEESETYFWAEHDSHVIQNTSEKNLFTITTTNFSDKSKPEDILIAKPFPSNTDIVRIKYFVNGKNFDYDWIDERWWEALIAEVKVIIGIGSEAQADHEAGNVNMEWRNKKGHSQFNKTQSKIKSSFFGSRRGSTHKY